MATKRMLSTDKKFEMNFQMLKERGKAVRKDISERCVSDIRSLVNVAKRINDIQDNLVRVIEQLRDEKIVMNN